MRARLGARALGAILLGVVLAACGDDDDDDQAETPVVCLAVQAWSDNSVEAVDAFREASRDLDPAGRRARYLEAFADVEERRTEFVAYLDGLDLDEPVRARLDEALAVVEQTIADGAAEAADLPDEAYATVAVGEGSLVTGVEKAKAVVFQALSELAEDPDTGIPRGCGRRGALDLSPNATYP